MFVDRAAANLSRKFFPGGTGWLGFMMGSANGGVPTAVVFHVNVGFSQFFEKMVVDRAILHPDQGIRKQRKAQTQNRNEIRFSHFLHFLKNMLLILPFWSYFVKGVSGKNDFSKKLRG